MRITAKHLLALLLPGVMLATLADAQSTGTRPATVLLSTVNTAHNAEGDIQQPTSGPYLQSVQVAAADPVISQLTGGADRTLSENWVAFKITAPAGVERIGAVVIRLKTTGTVNAGSFTTPVLFSDSGGKPNANIGPVGSGFPQQVFVSTLNGSTYTDLQFNVATNVVPATSYWVALPRSSINGGGSLVMDMTAAGTGLFATNNVDPGGTVPSGGGNWTLVNSVSPYFRILGDTHYAGHYFSDNYGGLSVQSVSGPWALRADNERGSALYGKSRDGFGLGGASVNSFGGRFSSLYGTGLWSESATGFGAVFSGVTGGAQIASSGALSITLQLVPTNTAAAIQVLDGTNGFVNRFQLTNSGLLQIYNGKVLAGEGVAYIVGSTGRLAAQGANIGTTNLVASAEEGMYEVCAHIAVRRAATTSSTMPAVNIGYNNGTAQTIALTATSTGNTLTTVARGCAPVVSSTGQAITYSTASFASSGATSMQYDLMVSARAIY